MAEIFKQKETFKVFRYNNNFLVGNYGTIKDSKTNQLVKQFISEKGYLMVLNPMKTEKNPREYEYVHRIVALTYVPGYTPKCGYVIIRIMTGETICQRI